MQAKWKVRHLIDGELSEAEVVGDLAEVAAQCAGLDVRAVVWHGLADSGQNDAARGSDSVSVQKK